MAAKWHPTQGLSPRQELQFRSELKRTNPEMYAYAETLGKGSDDLVWLKYKGLNDPGFVQWQQDSGPRAALQEAQTNTGGPKQFHDSKGARVVLGYGSAEPASDTDWQRYRDGELEIFTNAEGETRFVTPEQYQQFRHLDTTDRGRRFTAASLLQSRFDEPLGLVDRPSLFAPDEISLLPRSGAASGDYYGGAEYKTPEVAGYYSAQGTHNKYVKAIADALEEKGYFTDENGKPKMSGHKDPKGNKELTAREYFESSRRINYGHRGASSNAGFGSISSWIGNAGPEFEYFNQLESAILTPQEAININDANELQGRQGQLLWTSGNKARFDKVNAELDELVLSEGLDIDKGLSTRRTGATDYLGRIDDVDYPDDPQRSLIHSKLSDPNISGAESARSTHPYSLLNNQNQLTLGPRSRPEMALAQLGLLNQVEGFQTDAWLQNRGEERLRGIFGDTETDQIKTALQQQEGEKRWLNAVREAMDQIRAGGGKVKVEDIMQMAAKGGKLMGRGAIGLAPMIALMTNAEAAEAYDSISVDVGEELWSALATRAGAKETWDAFTSRVGQGLNTAASGAYGPQHQLGALGTQVAAGFGQAVATELPGLAAYFVNGLLGQPVGEGSDIVPEGVVPLFQESRPHLKYGGVLQNRYP